MDELDLKILRVLQENSSLTVTEIAKRVGLSASPCWKRINRLENDGVIKYQSAVLDGKKLGVNLTVFMSIRTGEHSGEWLDNFAKFINFCMGSILMLILKEITITSRRNQQKNRLTATRQMEQMLKIIISDQL